MHAPEVECIGRGKARAPYEFGCKVSIATPVTAPKGGQFVLHAKALHGNPYDGHTLGPVIADLEKLTGVTVRRIHGDKGYRGHNYPNRFKVWISGQVRRVTKAIRREMRRRAAIEPVIGHLKEDHCTGRNYLTGRDGDRINAVLAAAGYNFSLLLRWFEELLRVLSLILWRALLATPLHLTGAAKLSSRPTYYVMASSQTLGDALKRVARYSQITLVVGYRETRADAAKSSTAQKNSVHSRGAPVCRQPWSNRLYYRSGSWCTLANK